MKLITGFPCPGCGITKSFISFYEGDILRSFYYHLFGPFIIFFCVLTVIILSIELFTRKAYFRRILYSRRIAYIMAVILVIYHLTRLVVFVSTNNFDEILRQSIWK